LKIADIDVLVVVGLLHPRTVSGIVASDLTGRFRLTVLILAVLLDYLSDHEKWFAKIRHTVKCSTLRE